MTLIGYKMRACLLNILVSAIRQQTYVSCLYQNNAEIDSAGKVHSENDNKQTFFED